MAGRGGYRRLSNRQKEVIEILRSFPLDVTQHHTPTTPSQSSVVNPLHSSRPIKRSRSSSAPASSPIQSYKLENEVMVVYTHPDNTMVLSKCPLCPNFEFNQHHYPDETKRKRRFRMHLKKTHEIDMTLRHVISTPLLPSSDASQDLFSLFPNTLQTGGGMASSASPKTRTAHSYTDMMAKRSKSLPLPRRPEQDLDFSVFQGGGRDAETSRQGGGGAGSPPQGVRTARTYQQVLQKSNSGKS